MVNLKSKWKLIVAAVLATVAFFVGSRSHGTSRREKSSEKRAQAAEKVAVAVTSARLREQVRHEAENRVADLADGDVNDRAGEWARNHPAED